jgi:phosphohistidine phosphatase
MERIIVLARHARAEKGEPGQHDRERKLTDAGRDEVHRGVLALKGLGIEPEILLTSDAPRAMETALMMAEGLGLKPESLIPEPVLYGASPFDIVSLIRSVGDNRHCVMVCGHNPDISETGIFLTGDMSINLPTGGILILSYGGSSWEKLKPGRCEKRTIL